MKPIWLSLLCLAALPCPGAESFIKNPEEIRRIEQAVPTQAAAKPAKPRRLLIFTLNVGYGGHPSITYANEAFTQMGRRTGAFETVITNDPAVFERQTLESFDAVFFNNTVGNCFTNVAWRRNLQEFVSGGGGLMGVHGTSVAFTVWPGAVENWEEFGYMLGARGAAHKDSDERVWIRNEDPTHPLARVFDPQGFEFRDEYFRFGDPYSRGRVRVLLSIDTNRTDLSVGQPRGSVLRKDNDYALAWIRNYGRGRVFYSTIAHNPYVFWDVKVLQFYLGAIQYVLGDLPAPTTPSARLSPAVRKQEALGWKLGIEAYTFHKFTFAEAIDKTAELGLPFIGGVSFQKVSSELPKPFDPELSDAELEWVRLKLEQAGLRLVTYYIQDIPGDDAGCRKVFEFGRKMGIETFLSEPKLEALGTIERYCDRYGIKVALHNHDRAASPNYWNPEGILKACEGRSALIGAGADIGYWIRSGIDPVEGVRKLGKRLITLQMHDLHEPGASGHDVPWGTGAGKTAEIIREVRRMGLQPTLFGIEYSYDWLDSVPEIRQSIQFFNDLTLQFSE